MTDDKYREIRLKLKNDFEFYASNCLKIVSKSSQSNSTIIPFSFNKAQKYVNKKIEEQKYREGKVRAIILKGRQQGCSTLICAKMFHEIAHSFGVNGFILAHMTFAAENLHKMTKRFYENLHKDIKPEILSNNSKQLIFKGLDSSIKIGTAETKGIGRSATYHYFHASEFSLWPNVDEHLTGVFQSVPASNSQIYIESTANGDDNAYYDFWINACAGKNGYQPIFLPWYWQDEYRISTPEDFSPDEQEKELIALYGLDFQQLAFRRHKISEFNISFGSGDKMFQQEYPLNPAEAFISSSNNSYIDPILVQKARKRTGIEKNGNLIIGVDPARKGDDRTAIIRREGRVAYGLETYKKLDTMQIVGILHNIILTEKPKKVCIDFGLGEGVGDRLRELGHKDVVYLINFGWNALNKDRYSNKKAEMWGEMKKWLVECDPIIPDDNSLQMDLCSCSAKSDSISRLVIEKKKLLKSRGEISPDTADALALTFALPDTAYLQNNSIGNIIMQKTAYESQLINKAFG